MLFGLIRRVDPLEGVLDSERSSLFQELLEQALAEEEITSATAHPELSIENLRADASNAREEILTSAAIEEQGLRDRIRKLNTYEYSHRHWEAHRRLFHNNPLDNLMIVLFTGIVFGTGVAAWFVAYQWTGTWYWAIFIAVAAAGSAVAGAIGYNNDHHGLRRITYELFFFLLGACVPAYVGYRIAGGGWLGAALAIFPLSFFIVGVIFMGGAEEQVRREHDSVRYVPTQETWSAYDGWRKVLREVGVLAHLRDMINHTQLSRYSTVLSVRNAPGLRYLGDVRYHVPTSAREELVSQLSGVDGGSFALAGPRGAGKTILMRALCEGRYGSSAGQDLGVVVSAPVEYQARDFVLYLYTEVCRATKDHFSRRVPSSKQRRLFRRVNDLSQHELARRADRKLVQVRYLQSFSAEISAKGGVKFAELSAKAAASMAEQPLTYPEIVADLRRFLQAVADAVDGRLLIGIDELDRIGSGERARKFLDDIKAIFWVRGCYFLVSVSEDALRAFELTGHGLRDAFDSAFDEVIVVEHLDFEASTTLLRARVTGMPLPYHALAFCLSGGLPRELMRSARAIVDQRTPDSEVKLGQVTANLVANELARHSHAARLALADTGADAGKAADLLRRLDEPCPPTDEGLRAFAGEVTKAADGCSEPIRSLAESVATHAHYLAALAGVFSDQLAEADIRRATGKQTPVEGQFSTLARARRYLGVNDAFARMLVNGFRTTWR